MGNLNETLKNYSREKILGIKEGLSILKWPLALSIGLSSLVTVVGWKVINSSDNINFTSSLSVTPTQTPILSFTCPDGTHVTVLRRSADMEELKPRCA